MPAGAAPIPLSDPAWRRALMAVLAGSGFRLVAQPIADTAMARVGGYELLARFDGPPDASPDIWFAAARYAGLDARLTLLVIEQMHALRAARPDIGFLTVNVEPHLLDQPEVLEALLGDGRLERVVVELTEHVQAENDMKLTTALDAIREAGGLIAMDDAGTGYSGLSQMLRIRPDIVKLDRALVTGMDRDPVQRAAVHLLGDLAGQMNASLLAEGVETEGELAEVIRMGVPLVQGWAVGRPEAGWVDLTRDTQDFIARTFYTFAPGDHLLPLVRVATVIPSVMDTAANGVALAVVTGVPAGAVLVDARGRVRQVAISDPTGRVHLVPALTVLATSAPADVLRRAIARVDAHRYAPLVCTDARGCILGIVEISDLVHHVVGRPRM
jgi:EAL domain-containing protein (putative c-di-GMP-specific phosphodiesterase class I)